jgi:hypothetical protein
VAEEAATPSACRLRLTAELAVAPSLPALTGPGECSVEDAVRLEAVWLVDKTRVAVTPPAIVRCTFAEAIVHWVREDVASAVRSLGSALRSIDNYAAYECRGRNRIIGAKLSEHGKANAIDIRSLKLANGTVVELTDPHVAKDLRERCALGGSPRALAGRRVAARIVHVDLAERTGGHAASGTCVNLARPGQVPLRRPVRPLRHKDTVDRLVCGHDPAPLADFRSAPNPSLRIHRDPPIFDVGRFNAYTAARREAKRAPPSSNGVRDIETLLHPTPISRRCAKPVR